MSNTTPHTSTSHNVYLVIVFGVVMMDFMSTFFSLPLYWQLLGGTIKSYGVIMGLYPLARALGAPVVGLLARKIGMRWAFSMSLFSMILGNVIYLASSTHLATGEEIKEMKEDYESGGYPGSLPDDVTGMILLICSRLMVGFGSSCLSLVTTAIVHSGHTEVEKHVVINRTRISGAIGSAMGNILVVVCLNVFDDTYAAGFMLNGFTIPIVFTMLCEATLLGGSYFFAPPLEEAEDFVGLYRSTESQKNYKQTVALNVLVMVASIIQFLYFAQLVPIASLYYHVIHTSRQFYKAFMPNVIGLIFGLIACKKIENNVFMMKLGCFFGVIGCMLLFGWGEPPNAGEEDFGWFFYIGGSIYFLGSGMITTGSRNALSRLIEKSEYVSTLTCWVFICTGIGMFLGSSLGSLFLSTGHSTSPSCQLGHGNLATTFFCIELYGINGFVGFCLAMFCVLFGGISVYQYFQNKLAWDAEEEETLVDREP